MDSFTQRMLERAKARREKLDTQFSDVGHEIRPRRSPLKDANAIVMPATKLSSSLNATTKSTKKSLNISVLIESPSKSVKVASKTSLTPEKHKKNVEEVTNKENESQMVSSVKSKLQRLGKLYSDDDSRELSSLIHRTEEKFSAEESSDEEKSTKRNEARLDRLATISATVNNWKDDLSHPELESNARDPAGMSLSKKMVLFERNKDEVLIPKAPLTLSVSTNKLQESSKSFNQNGKNNSLNKSVMNSTELFEKGLIKQELNNDILRDTQTERQKELALLRSRFNKNEKSAHMAAGSCIQPKKNSYNTTNGSPKNSPVSPVKSTSATDHILELPPLPQNLNTLKKQKEKVLMTKQVFRSPPQSQRQSKQAVSEVKCIRVSPSKPEFIKTETTDGEFTLATTKPKTVILEERYDKSDSDFDTDDCHQDEENTSFETNILKVITGQIIASKRQIESDAESYTSDISVLDKMDEYLDACLANQESTLPKLNRESTSPSTAPSSFKYSASSHSPIKVTSRSSIKNDIVEDDNHVSLIHSVSFYRRQQSTPKTPVKQVSRLGMTECESKVHDNSQEASLVEDKIKRLMDEVCKQQTIIGQASQALNLCTATIEFSGSREQVEGERLLLIATHRRQAALNEIERLKIEGTLRPAVLGESLVEESGSLTISELTFPLKKDYDGNRDMCLHFLCLVRHLDIIVATPVVQVEPGDSCIRFPSTLKLDNLYSDFKITIEVYSLETRAEILPHEIKYHIHTNGYHGKSTANKKASGKTPKKLLKQEKLIMPIVQSSAGLDAVRSLAFELSGYVVFSLKEINDLQFTLNKVPHNSTLEGHLRMHVSCELSISVEHRGFLTMFEDVAGFGAWHRRWCLLKGDTLSYWKYPDDERKKTPIGSLELQGVVTKNVGLVSRNICARPNTFLLETVKPTQSEDTESMVVVKNESLTTIRHLLSADTKEERLEWCSKLNQNLNLIRAWGGGMLPGY